MLIRAMREGADNRPELGRSRSKLGVVVDGDRPDIPVDGSGMVRAATGGMSVVTTHPADLVLPRRPKRWGGQSNYTAFVLDNAHLGTPLAVRQDGEPSHSLVEPAYAMRLEDYETAIGETRDHWEEWHDN